MVDMDFGQMLRQVGRDLSGASNLQNSTPSALQELAAYQQMTPEQQAIYWQVKRAAPVVNLGDKQAVLSPQGTGQPVLQLPIGLKPEDQPNNAAAKISATEEAKNKAAADALADKKTVAADSTLGLIEEARSLLPQASSGLSGKVGAVVKGTGGYSDEATQADKQLKVLAAALVGNVPRMEGPQSDKDVAMYREAAGDVANISIPRKDRLAALDQIEKLQKKYSASAITSVGGGKIRVQNPQGQTGTIDASELNDALANGWKKL